jgi:hypothetical protein
MAYSETQHTVGYPLECVCLKHVVDNGYAHEHCIGKSCAHAIKRCHTGDVPLFLILLLLSVDISSIYYDILIWCDISISFVGLIDGAEGVGGLKNGALAKGLKSSLARIWRGERWDGGVRPILIDGDNCSLEPYRPEIYPPIHKRCSNKIRKKEPTAETIHTIAIERMKD